MEEEKKTEDLPLYRQHPVYRAKFHPSHTKTVRFVDGDGNVTRIERLNRKQRRRMGIR